MLHILRHGHHQPCGGRLSQQRAEIDRHRFDRVERRVELREQSAAMCGSSGGSAMPRRWRMTLCNCAALEPGVGVRQCEAM